MNLGNSLFEARKSRGLSQEAVAEKLGVSRQTISKWETDETLPDIRQSKKLAVLYGRSLDELIDFDIGVKEIQDAIDRTSEETSAKIDWTKAWSKIHLNPGTEFKTQCCRSRRRRARCPAARRFPQTPRRGRA